MIALESIKGFFPEELRAGQFAKHILKEYVECLALEWIARSQWAPRLTFIGGTNLRLTKDIDRFSEDLDFDCKDLEPEEFVRFTDALIAHLRRNGLNAVSKEKESDRLTAMRRSILFPGLLHELGLSAFKEERFMMKVEAQDQGREYKRVSADIRRCGFFFPVTVPNEATLCAMKLSALLTRGKGRDFYDAIFLLQRTEPDYPFLSAVHPEVTDLKSLKAALTAKAKSVDLELKRRDVEHLLFHRERAELVTRFPAFVDSL
ncbi:MAG: nucleotidyl transferase AbiEii/AbiGii toxin family protein [Kiritimatiellae bacterium]|jgi:predicted nucleotidyltransferase component of viral defense system|nr:nucleotidyl transferase AbiEii/AbiGii toxin family protein [Kiritimatiellia bacterium]